MPKPNTASRPVDLLLADVDGTLVTAKKELTPRAITAVQRLHEAGIIFAITSGRPPQGMAMLVEPLAITTPIAAFNGGLFVTPELATIEQHVLPADVSAAVVKTLELHGLDVWVYRGNDWFVKIPHGRHVDREESTVKFPPIVVDSFDKVLDTTVKIVGVSDDFEAVAKCEADARHEFGDHVSAARSQPYYLDVTHPQANKGGVVKWLSKRFGVPTERIATIGDMPNDVLMFALSGLSIAMGNASPEVQRTARRVTTSNEQDGFGNAVEKYVLPSAS